MPFHNAEAQSVDSKLWVFHFPWSKILQIHFISGRPQLNHRQSHNEPERKREWDRERYRQRKQFQRLCLMSSLLHLGTGGRGGAPLSFLPDPGKKQRHGWVKFPHLIFFHQTALCHRHQIFFHLFVEYLMSGEAM